VARQEELHMAESFAAGLQAGPNMREPSLRPPGQPQAARTPRKTLLHPRLRFRILCNTFYSSRRSPLS